MCSIGDALDIVNPLNYFTPSGWKKFYTADKAIAADRKKQARLAALKTPEQIKAPTPADASVMQADADTRARAAIMANANIKTSGLGLGTTATTKKRLLGE